MSTDVTKTVELMKSVSPLLRAESDPVIKIAALRALVAIEEQLVASEIQRETLRRMWGTNTMNA